MNRLSDYLNHIKHATTDACGFVEGLEKEDFLVDDYLILLSIAISESV